MKSISGGFKSKIMGDNSLASLGGSGDSEDIVITRAE